tara:strand:- start:1438 stop:1707 length:270 start_codon:yes stop_codon:yes gene_type:complete
MEEPIDPDNLPHFQIPENFLDQLYDFTGGADTGGGFVLSYVDDRGKPLVYSRTSSQIVEMGLRKALEKYLTEIEEGETSFDFNEEGFEE